MTANEAIINQEIAIWKKIDSKLKDAIVSAVYNGDSYAIVKTTDDDYVRWQEDYEGLRKLGYTIITPVTLEYHGYDYREYCLDNYCNTIIRWNNKY